MEIPSKTEVELPYEPIVPLLCVRVHTHTHTYIYGENYKKNLFCLGNNMCVPEEDYAKWNQSDRDKYYYDTTYMWNLKHTTN